MVGPATSGGAEKPTRAASPSSRQRLATSLGDADAVEQSFLAPHTEGANTRSRIARLHASAASRRVRVTSVAVGRPPSAGQRTDLRNSFGFSINLCFCRSPRAPIWADALSRRDQGNWPTSDGGDWLSNSGFWDIGLLASCVFCSACIAGVARCEILGSPAVMHLRCQTIMPDLRPLCDQWRASSGRAGCRRPDRAGPPHARQSSRDQPAQ